MKRTNIIQAAKKTTVAALTALMLFSGVPTRAIAEVVDEATWALSQQQAQDAADVEQPADEQSSPRAIVFDGNGATDGWMDPLAVGDDADTPLSFNAYVRNGYEFTGWSTTPSGKDEGATPAYAIDATATVRGLVVSFDKNQDGQIGDEERVDLTALASNGTVTLYAQWAQKDNPSEAAPVMSQSDAVALQQDATLVDAPMLAENEVAELDAAAPEAARFVAGVTSAAANDPDGSVEDAVAGAPTSADGTSIDSMSVSWITKDTEGHEDNDPKKLTLAPYTNEKFDVRMRVSFQLSGQNDYEPGTIRLTIPKTLIKTRDGKTMGTFTLSVPEAPSDRAAFAYYEQDDSYVLVNMVKLAASTSALFEFSQRDVVPSQVMGNPKKTVEGISPATFASALEVTTPKGTTLARNDSMTATVETAERLYEYGRLAASSSVLYDSWKDSWPEQLKPTDPEQYVYIDWYGYNDTWGNQSFVSASEFTMTTGYPKGSVLLGMIDTNGAIVKAVDGSASVSSDWGQQPNYQDTLTAHAYVAIPKDKVDRTKNQTFKATMRFSLKAFDTISCDNEQLSTYNREGVFTLNKEIEPITQPFPQTAFGLKKRGINNKNALDDLLLGKDVTATYSIECNQAGGYLLRHDTSLPASSFSPDQIANDATIHTVITDDAVSTGGLSGAFSSNDYELDHLTFKDARAFAMYQLAEDGYGSIVPGQGEQYLTKGSWVIKSLGDSFTPELTVEAKDGTGAWVKVATVSYQKGNASVIPVDGIEGLSCDREMLKFAPSTCYTGFRITADVPVKPVDDQGNPVLDVDGNQVLVGALRTNVMPTIRLKASSEKIVDYIRGQFDQASEPSMYVDNTVRVATECDGHAIWNDRETGSAMLTGGFTQRVESRQYEIGKSENKSQQRYDLIFTNCVSETSSLSNAESYNAAVGDGSLKQETSGTFYDLLPQGVYPDTSSIKLRPGDKIESVEVLQNYKNSGRTLLKVRATLKPRPIRDYWGNGFVDDPLINFKATYSFDDASEFGTTLTNIAAFESGNEQLGDVMGYMGENNNAISANATAARKYNNFATADAVRGFEDILCGLNEDSTAKNFVYSRRDVNLGVLDHAIVGNLNLKVSPYGAGTYGQGNDAAINVNDGGAYTYQLRFTSTDESSGFKNIVLYDNLEVAKPKDANAEDSTWQGSFAGIDVSAISAAGANPVVYYAKKNIDLSKDSDDLNLDDAGLWSVTPPENLSEVRAIAIDVRHAADGSDFSLAQGKSVSALVHMRAPRAADLAANNGGNASDYYDNDATPEAGLTGGVHAYNESTATFEYAGGTQKFLTSSMTKVGLAEFVLTVTKKWNDNDNADSMRPSSLRVRLVANGVKTEHTAELNAENGWKYTFAGLDSADGFGNSIRYAVAEENASSDYRASQSEKITQAENPHCVVTDAFELTNTYEPQLTTVAGTKIWNDDNNAAGKRPGSIEVNLYADGKLVQSKKVYGDENDAKWSFSFEGLRLNGAPDTPIRYTVDEQYVAGYDTVVDEDGNITNTYDPYGDLIIRETVKNATPQAIEKDPSFIFRLDLTAPDGSPDGGRYAYEIFNSDGSSSGVTGYVGTGGTIALKRDQSVRIVDIPSETKYCVTQADVAGYTLESVSGEQGAVRAGDSRVSCADFVNVYASKGTVDVSAVKVLQDGKQSAGQYAFSLCSIDEGTGKRTPIRSGYNDKNGKVVFGLLRYNEGDSGKTFRYVIVEKEGERPGVEYSKGEIAVTVKVADNGDGTMTCELSYAGGDGTEEQKAESTSPKQLINIYRASGQTSLVAWKSLKNGELQQGQFTFKVEADENAPETPMPASNETTNGANGMVLFGPITFNQTHIGKSYSYLVSEVADGDSKIAYDHSKFKYTVTPKDNGDGTISFDQKLVRVKEDGTEEEIEIPVFQNKAVDGSLQVKKYVKSGDPESEFTFWLKLTGDETQMPASINPSLERLSDTAPDLQSKAVAAAADDAEQPAGILETVAGWGSSLLGLFMPTEAHAEILEGEFSISWYLQDKASKYSYDTKSCQLTIHAGMLDNGNGMYGQDRSVSSVLNRTNAGNIPTAKVKSVVFEENVTILGASCLFKNCTSLESVEGTPAFDKGATSLDYAFYGCGKLKNINFLERWDVSNMKSLVGTFEKCSSLEDVNALKSWDVSNVTHMGSIFDTCSALADISGLQDWNVSNVYDLSSVFYGCVSIESLQSLSEWNFSKSYCEGMFYGCNGLKSLDGLQNWNVSNLESSYLMFAYCKNLEDVSALDNWRWPNERYMFASIFKGCESLKSITVSPYLANTIETNYSERYGLDWLPNASQELPYTGKWVRQVNGIQSPDPAEAFGSDNLAKDINAYIIKHKDEAPMTFVWQIKPVDATIVFDANDGSGLTNTHTYKVTDGTTLPACSFDKYERDFIAWNTKADGTGESYSDGAVIDENSSDFPAGSTTTLYAQWKAKDHTANKTDRGYKITLHGNEAATITGLPAGMGYQLLEETSAGWVLVGSSGASGVIKSGETSTATFVNDYQPAKARVTIQASKTLDGLPAEDGAFEFELYGNDGTLPQKKPNAVGGGVSFDAIEYDAAGTYKYQIKEIKGSDKAINYSDAVHNVTVTVSNNDGVLSASVKYDGGDALPVFQNTTKTTSLIVRKAVEGTEGKTQGFTFQVKIGSDAPKTITLKADESRKFDGLKPGTAYSVTEVDLPSGYTTDQALYSGTIDAGGTTVTVTNKYSASDASVGIKVVKKLEGGTLVGGEFKFGLYEQGKSNAEDPIAVAYNDAFGNVAFSPVPVSEDTEFDVREIAESANADVDCDGSVKTVAVKVTDNGRGAKSAKQEGEPPVFTNTMKTGALVVSNEIRNTTAASKDKRFVYTLTATDEAGEPLKDLAITYPDGTSGVISSGETFKLGNGESASVAMPSRSSYNVVQTDLEGFTGENTGSTGSVDLRTEETKSAVAAFVNTYYATGSFTPKVKKEFQGEELQADAFSFELRDAAGTLIARAQNAADGTVAFSNVAFDQADFVDSSTKDLSYTVTEVKGARDDVEYDLVPVTVSVTVTDDGKGNLVAGTPTYVKDGATGSDTITNLRTVVLPKTGAAGIWAGVIAGLAIVAASVIAIIRRRKQ